MDEVVQIPVTINGEEREFPAQVQAWRYGVRFRVDVNGVEMIFERDDAGEFRAILPEGFGGKMPDRGIITGIAEVLNAL